MSTDKIFIKNTAPSLCGIKPANLFSISSSCQNQKKINLWKYELSAIGLSLFEIPSGENFSLLFLCDINWIKKIISLPQNKKFFKSFGYTVVDNPYSMLFQIFSRISDSKNFPHEIGLFLGYPLNDVINFINHHGKNCKLCGYWKSYSNVEQAQQKFIQYKNCSRLCCKLFDQGYSVQQIINEYKKAVSNAA